MVHICVIKSSHGRLTGLASQRREDADMQGLTFDPMHAGAKESKEMA